MVLTSYLLDPSSIVSPSNLTPDEVAGDGSDFLKPSAYVYTIGLDGSLIGVTETGFITGAGFGAVCSTFTFCAIFFVKKF